MDSLYNRYASALFSIAKEKGCIEEYRSEIKLLIDVLKDNVDLEHLFSSWFIELKEKEDIIDKVFNDFKEDIRNFIKVIVANRRGNELHKILEEYVKISNAELGIEEGIVYSTEKLTKAQIDKIEKKLSEVTKVKVELVNRIDERLIGGIKVVLNDSVYDGSLRNKIESLRKALLKGDR